jgi:broad specificity phosphatase PhoE
VTTLLLVRHAAHDWLGRGIPGRLPGVALNDEGRSQARELAQRLEGVRIDAIYSSPQQRARETVAPLASQLHLPVAIANEGGDPALWHRWVERRSIAQPPGGEAFAQVAQRVMAGMKRLRDLHPRQSVLVLSHGDVIKAALACCLAMSLDNLERFDIAPASLSVLAAQGEGWKVRVINQALTGPVLPP